MRTETIGADNAIPSVLYEMTYLPPFIRSVQLEGCYR